MAEFFLEIKLYGYQTRPGLGVVTLKYIFTLNKYLRTVTSLLLPSPASAPPPIRLLLITNFIQ